MKRAAIVLSFLLALVPSTARAEELPFQETVERLQEIVAEQTQDPVVCVSPGGSPPVGIGTSCNPKPPRPVPVPLPTCTPPLCPL